METACSAVAVGLAQGYQPICAFNMGAKNYMRVAEAYKEALFAAMIISVLAFWVFQLSRAGLPLFFGAGSER